MDGILRFIYIFIIIIYILQLSPILSIDVLNMMNTFYIKMILLLVILLLSYLQPSLGIISALAFLITFIYMHNNLSVSLIMENSINEHFNNIKNDMQNRKQPLFKETSKNMRENSSDINKNINIRMNSDIDIWNTDKMIETDETDDNCDITPINNMPTGSYVGMVSTENTLNTFMNLV